MKTIKTHRGLDIPLDGVAAEITIDRRCVQLYGITPGDYVGLEPRLLVKEGDRVEAGQPIIEDKRMTRVKLCSTVSGVVKEVRRGERRKIIAIVIERSGEQNVWQCDKNKMESRDGAIEVMTQCGLWASVRQRPFGTIADPNGKARDVVVSLFDTAPSATNYEYTLKGREVEVAKGLEILAKMTEGRVIVGYRKGHLAKDVKTLTSSTANIEMYEVEGPHPAGNIGVILGAVAPINKGDTVWTMKVADIATLGHLALTGIYKPERIVAIVGPDALKPQYCKITNGANIGELIEGEIANDNYPSMSYENNANIRIVSGNVLSGRKVCKDDFIGAYDNEITLIAEGDKYDFMGWISPGVKKYSFSRTFASGFIPKGMWNKISLPNWMKPRFDTNLHGGERPFVFNGNFERVVPMDIYPLQLIKAAIIGDVELMEELGIYEIEPEDLALCEFIDPSKNEIQTIIRAALEQCRKEAM